MIPAHLLFPQKGVLALNSDAFDLLIYKRLIHPVSLAHYDPVSDIHSLCDLAERSILSVEVR